MAPTHSHTQTLINQLNTEQKFNFNFKNIYCKCFKKLARRNN